MQTDLLLSGRRVIAASTVNTFNNRENDLSGVVESTGEIADSQMPDFFVKKKKRHFMWQLSRTTFLIVVFFFKGLFLVEFKLLSTAVLHYVTFLLSTFSQNV